MKSPRGGARPGAGKPKGTKWPSTLAKEAARELTRQLITAQLGPMIEAQILNAQGIKHLMMRDPETGKFERVKVNEDADRTVQEAQIDAALASGNAFWMFTKDPSVQAFTDLLNRALDKPAEQLKVTGPTGGPLEIVVKKPW